MPPLVESGLAEADAKRIANESASEAITCIFSEIDRRDMEDGEVLAIEELGDYAALFDEYADLTALMLRCFKSAMANAGVEGG